MKRIIIGLVLVLLSAGVIYAAPDSVLMGGDVRITGTQGVNGLVFPDSSVQYKAAETSTLAIGTIATGSAGATITGTPPNQVLNITFPAAGTYPGHVLISPNKNLKIADTLQLVATSFNSSNNQFPSHNYTWNSLNPTIATVSNTGLVTAVDAGTAIITILDTTNNVSGQIAINVISLTGDWICSNCLVPNPTCPVVSLCTFHVIESKNGSISVTTTSCKDSCGNDYNTQQSGTRIGSRTNMEGTLTYTPSGGTTGTIYEDDCINTWDGNNSVAIMCVLPDIPQVINAHMVRN